MVVVCWLLGLVGGMDMMRLVVLSCTDYIEDPANAPIYMNADIERSTQRPCSILARMEPIPLVFLK
jgi:hypothetical protein